MTPSTEAAINRRRESAALDFAVLPRVVPVAVRVGNGVVRGYAFKYGPDRAWLFGMECEFFVMPHSEQLEEATGCRHVIYKPDASIRIYSSIVLSGSDPDYRATAQVFAHDDVGLMYAVSGRDFYRCFSERFTDLIAQLDIHAIEAAVMPDHYRLMRMAMRRVADVQDCGPCRMAERDMVWVRVTPKER